MVISISVLQSVLVPIRLTFATSLEVAMVHPSTVVPVVLEIIETVSWGQVMIRGMPTKCAPMRVASLMDLILSVSQIVVFQFYRIVLVVYLMVTALIMYKNQRARTHTAEYGKTSNPTVMVIFVQKLIIVKEK